MVFIGILLLLRWILPFRFCWRPSVQIVVTRGLGCCRRAESTLWRFRWNLRDWSAASRPESAFHILCNSTMTIIYYNMHMPLYPFLSTSMKWNVIPSKQLMAWACFDVGPFFRVPSSAAGCVWTAGRARTESAGTSERKISLSAHCFHCSCKKLQRLPDCITYQDMHKAEGVEKHFFPKESGECGFLDVFVYVFVSSWFAFSLSL